MNHSQVPEEVDYILVGSGISSALVAHTLLQQNPDTSILVLEAGPLVEMKSRRLWWDYVVSGTRPYGFCEDQDGGHVSEGNVPWGFKESRIRIYGGSTVHWGGWSLRLQEEDFKLKSNTGRGADWPLALDDLLPYYRSAERLLSVNRVEERGGDGKLEELQRSQSGPQDHLLQPFQYTAADELMIRAMQDLGIGYAHMPVARHRKCMTTGTCKYCPVGARFSASYVWDALLAHEPDGASSSLKSSKYDLWMKLRAPASRLLMKDRSTVRGVQFFDYECGEEYTVRARRILVAAGALESPKLLQRSVSPWWNRGVGNDFDLLGRHLITHPFLFVRGRLPDNPSGWQQEMDFPTLMSRHYDKAKNQVDEMGKLFMFKSRSRPRVDLSGMMRAGVKRKEIDLGVAGPMEFELQGFMEEFSNYHNRVTNGPGVDQFGIPNTRVGFSRNPDFGRRKEHHLANMVEVVKKMGCKVVSADIRGLRGDHASASARMATHPEQGVVDANLKVFDVDNLYVCSNAVFPSGAVVNPTLTLAALALRLGAHLSAGTN